MREAVINSLLISEMSHEWQKKREIFSVVLKSEKRRKIGVFWHMQPKVAADSNQNW